MQCFCVMLNSEDRSTLHQDQHHILIMAEMSPGQLPPYTQRAGSEYLKPY